MFFETKQKMWGYLFGKSKAENTDGKTDGKQEQNLERIELSFPKQQTVTEKDGIRITTKLDTITITKPGNYVLTGDIHANLSLESPGINLYGQGHTIHGWLHVIQYPDTHFEIKECTVEPPDTLLRTDPCKLCHPDTPSNSSGRAVISAHKDDESIEGSNGSSGLFEKCNVLSPCPLEHHIGGEGTTINQAGKEEYQLKDDEGFDTDTWKASPLDRNPRAGLCKYGEHCDGSSLEAACCSTHKCKKLRCHNIKLLDNDYCEFHQSDN